MLAGPAPRILVLSAPYYRDVVDGMLHGARRVFADVDAKVEVAEVAGGFELPAALAMALKLPGRWDGFLLLGCVVKGETDHYTFICDAICNGVMALSTAAAAPIGFGLLTVDSMDQAVARSRDDRMNKGGRGRPCGAGADRARPWLGDRGMSLRPKPAGRPRTGARVAAVQALFQSEQTGESAETVAQQFIRHRIGAGDGDGAFDDGQVPLAHIPLFEAILKAAATHAEAADAEIRAHLQRDWTLERLDPVLRALLRAAAAELMSGREPPARVVINEYLDIVRGFLDEETSRFANGVLDAMAHTLRPQEFGAGR